MKIRKKKILCAVLACIMIFSLHTAVVAGMTQEEYGEYQYQVLEHAANIISAYYKFGTKTSYLLTAAFYEKLTNPDADIEDMIAKMMSTLDPNSTYLTNDEYQQMINHTIVGEFGGIGVSIMERSGRIIVVDTIEGSPARKAGILPNDVIASVDGVNVLGKSPEYLQTYASGAVGTPVTIGILRGDQELSFDLIRDVIKDTCVFATIDEGVGYLRVGRFNQTTTPDTKRALAAFDVLGVDKIIIDIRDNPGGELNSVVDFCNLFIPKGVVASTHYLDESADEVFYSNLEETKYKIAVLVNSSSASAAELFAAAVKDTESGVVIGETTYGKGTMQAILSFPDTGGALRLTIAEYYSAGGNRVNNVGVIPDQTVLNKAETKDVSYFSDLDVTVESKLYDDSQNVLALEQRLDFLGYLTCTPDSIFDEKTENALKTYQIYRNLPSTGTLNMETALDLNSLDYGSFKFEVDKQYETAKNYLKTGVIE